MKLDAPVTDADRKAAAKFAAELDAAGQLADPRKAIEVVLAQSIATVRAAQKKTVAPRGDTVKLADGTVVRVQKSGHFLAVYMDGRCVYSLSAPEVRRA